MKYFVINLNRSMERWEILLHKVPEHLKSELFRFEAIDGSVPELIAPWRSRVSKIKSWCWGGKTLTNGEVACYASHFLLWEKCVELNEPIVVLEDDILFGENFETKITEVENSGYDYVKLYVISSKRLKKLNESYSWALGNTTGTQGYFITPAAARRFLENAGRWSEAVDVYMDQYWKHGNITVVTVPFIISENNLISKQTTIQNREKTKSVFLKMLHKVSREFIRVKYRFDAYVWRKRNRETLREITKI